MPARSNGAALHSWTEAETKQVLPVSKERTLSWPHHLRTWCGKQSSEDTMCQRVANSTCTEEIQQFLGLATYYRKFVKNFAQIAAPLYRLSEKKKTWIWNEESEVAFDALKKKLTSAPILAFPDFMELFILDADASSYGLGAVLAQTIGGKEQVVAFASRTLTKAERRYCATRHEMLALVWAIRHFRPYLYGKMFTVCTNHNSLKWLQSFRDPEGLLARWLKILAEYQFTVEHRPGSKHVNADALSRIPCKQCGLQEKLEETPVEAVIMATEILPKTNSPEIWSWAPAWSSEELRTLQQADPSTPCYPVVYQMIRYRLRFPHKGSHALWTKRQLLKDGIFYRNWEDVPGRGRHQHLQLILPQELHVVPTVLDALHNHPTAGHLGVLQNNSPQTHDPLL